MDNTIPKRRAWPFKDMQIGDCHTFPADIGPKAQVQCHTYARASGKKFTTQQQPDRSIKIWRLE